MKHNVCVIGGINFAVISKIDSNLQDDSSICGEIKVRFGGVARNIILNLAKYDDLNIDFITILSKDILGKMAQQELDLYHVNYEKSIFEDKWESFYCETITSGAHYGINDMKAIEKLLPNHIKELKSYIENHDILVIDTNINQETLEFIASNIRIPIVCDATSDQKCRRLLNVTGQIDTIKMNYREACALLNIEPQSKPNIEKIKTALLQLPIINCYVTLGELGSFYLSKTEYYYQTVEKKLSVKNVLGAGDAFTASMIAGKLNGIPVSSILKLGTIAAEKILVGNN